MQSQFPVSKQLILILVFVLVWLVSPVFLRDYLRNGFYEFQAPAKVVGSYLTDLQQYWSLRKSKDNLIDSSRELARLNAAYELRLQRAKHEKEELIRLEEMLGMPSYPEYRYEVARVIRRNMNTWTQHLIIRKGKRHGIEDGMAVVYVGGVVGRVKNAHAFTSEVELITSPTFRMVAHVEGDNRPIEFHGRINAPFGPPTGNVKNVPYDVSATVSEPKLLLSSRLGGIFPDGLAIGYITGLNPGTDGLFKAGKVRIDERLLSIEELAVLVPIIEHNEEKE